MNPPRIEPLSPPYTPELDALLARMTPPGAPSILALFRVMAHNPELAARATGWGGYLLGRKATLTLRDREVVIDRVCALCGAAYEWGVHVAAFAEAAGFSPRETAAIADPHADPAVLGARDRLLVRLVDELHVTSHVGDALWEELAAEWSPAQLVELLMLAGWYRAISYVCNAARVPPEPWAARWAHA
ncbi:carboxymuconolactone decarboxylase family protein [Caenimonas aquaedulcis]|uniref:Carboxymuconolactone decarboxylase family protein n=1 Tax=Caenimonas aquaedulcis TaxID=2793270 RepID=A0A931H0Z4_9BURK|nr:carboxymuconolactone decarboxylase family protein [Caenimonas aquaedulcis]MBG9386560.1 carboxymuconolactone decarboxylase family protein [Caenimonas aquaedulcis]